MPRSKEISEDIRRKVVEAHESGKGYKLISKAIGLPKTTIRAILRKWKRFGTVVTLPRSGRPSKISPRARREIIREVMKNPCTTSKDLQATLASSNICVHQSTIRRILGIHGRPTLSSFEGSMALQSSSQDEDGMLNASDGSNQDIKNEEEWQVINLNTNSDHGSKHDSKFPDNKSNEGAGHEENKDDEKEKRDDEMPSADVIGHNGGQRRDGGEESEKRDSGTQTASTIANGGGRADANKKRDVETVIVNSGPSGGGDARDGIQHDASYTTGRDANSAYSNNNDNNNNNNNGGNWSEEMDYISTLTFS